MHKNASFYRIHFFDRTSGLAPTPLYNFLKNIVFYIKITSIISTHNNVSVAQSLCHWAMECKVPGSNPGDPTFFHFYLILTTNFLSPETEKYNFKSMKYRIIFHRFEVNQWNITSNQWNIGLYFIDLIHQIDEI